MTLARLARVLLLVLFVATRSESQPVVYEAGRHFEMLPERAGAEGGEQRTVVVAFFAYDCASCRDLEPWLDAWVATLRDSVKLIRLPVTLDRNSELYARAFHVADATGVLNLMHEALYDEILSGDRALESVDAWAELFMEFGVSDYWFRVMFNSVDIERRLRYASDLAATYDVRGVPVFVIDGAVRLESEMAHGNDVDLLAVLGALAVNGVPQ